MSLALRKPRTVDQYDTSNDGPESARDEAADYDDGLLTTAGPIMMICYALLFSIAAFTFMSSGSAFFAVAISTFFAVIFFAIPYVFFRIRSGHDKRWRNDPEAGRTPFVETWTGSMRRWEAIVQIVSIPIAILLGFTLLAIRWSAL